jgi:hypothetical protein
MGSQTNERIVQVSSGLIPLAVVVFVHFGFSVLKIVAILLPVLVVLAIIMFAAAPGPKAKEVVERKKGRRR